MRLETQELIVRRAGQDILDRASLCAESGEMIGVIGANGAGKSTLLSVLAGLLKPDTGMVRLDGRSLAEIRGRDLARVRAYLPQNPRCEWPISVERLVALGLTPSLPAIGRMPSAYQTQIAATLADCDLTDRRDQAATTLSGGELARAMLARALVGNPKILIADEPITGLDPRHALDTMRRLRTLAENGTLVIAALHDLTLAARYATRIVALHRGQVAADGATASTLNPALLREIFDVEACVHGTGDGAFVDFMAPP
ncbi:MAG TPA: ABC transporter ATP-binding protein [Micropepsaceae bacterium]|nr:ABC transporter ATP-binding protein [Micropepsaceae bacterium]